MTNKNEQRKVPELRFPEFSGEWKRIILGDSAVIKGRLGWKGLKQEEYVENGYSYLIAGKHIKNGSIDWDKADQINKQRYDESIEIALQNGDVIFSKDGSLGNPAQIKELKKPATINSTMMLIRTDKNTIIPDFMYQVLNSNIFKKLIHLKVSGSSIPHLFQADMKEFTFYIPSIKEQQKIGEFFSKLDRQIELEEKKLALLEEQKKGYMQKIFSQELRFKDENGEEYPEWERVKLVDICNFRRGSFPQPYGDRRWYDSENGKPFVQVFDVDTNMKIKKMTKNKISKIAEAKSVIAKPGNILVTLQGSIGRVAVLEYEAFVDRTLLIINDFLVDIDPDFFKYLLLLKFDEEKRKAPGGTIKTITKEVLSEFKVKLPVFEYQQKVALMFKDIDERLIRQNRKISLLNERKNNLLNKIFI